MVLNYDPAAIFFTMKCKFICDKVKPGTVNIIVIFYMEKINICVKKRNINKRVYKYISEYK